MDLIKPGHLKKGDTIGILAPSSGLSAKAPHRLDSAISFLKGEGYTVKVLPTARASLGYSSATAEKRADDINCAFADSNIKAILCTIGGNTANQTLKFLDFGLMRRNPKIFCGYSDISVLHYALRTHADIASFYGPCAVPQFGEYPKPMDYTVRYFLKAVSSTEPVGEAEPSKSWTDDTPDWLKKEDLKGPRLLKSNKGYEWLREGSASGPLLGGCLPSILHLKGTEFWPSHKGAILFLDIPESHDFRKGEPVSEAAALLTDLELYGTLQEIKGMVVGRPMKYSAAEDMALKEALLEATGRYDTPILYGADIGHTDPMLTLPIGADAKIDSEEGSFIIRESCVS